MWQLKFFSIVLHEKKAPKVLWKILFILSKKLFSSSRCSSFCTSLFPFSFTSWPLVNLYEKLIDDKSYSLWHWHNFQLEFNIWDSKVLILIVGQLIKFFIRKIFIKKYAEISDHYLFFPNDIIWLTQCHLWTNKQTERKPCLLYVNYWTLFHLIQRSPGAS